MATAVSMLLTLSLDRLEIAEHQNLKRISLIHTFKNFEFQTLKSENNDRKVENGRSKLDVLRIRRKWVKQTPFYWYAKMNGPRSEKNTVILIIIERLWKWKWTCFSMKVAGTPETRLFYTIFFSWKMRFGFGLTTDLTAVSTLYLDLRD